jgi:predicted methyltransferase
MYAVGKCTVNHCLIGGGRMILDTNNHLAQQIRCEKAFETKVRQEFERIAAYRVNVIDIGANTGYYTILASRLVGSGERVFSFEPQASVVSKLRRNIELNTMSNVEVFPIALADTPGTAIFNVPSAGRKAIGSTRTDERL